MCSWMSMIPKYISRMEGRIPARHFLLCPAKASNRFRALYQDRSIPNRDTQSAENEHIDPSRGKLQLHYIDLFIPGNAASTSRCSARTTPGTNCYRADVLGVGWTMHFGGCSVVPS